MLDTLRPIAHNAMRIGVAFAYWTHGGQKVLGWFGGFGPDGGTADMMTRFGIAGSIELVGGLLVMIGLFTRPVAFIVAGEMAVAYWWIHFSRGGLWHWANGGELALIYCFVFLFIAAAGPGAFSVDGWLKRRQPGNTT